MTKPARDDAKRAAKIRERRKTIALDLNSSDNAILYTNVKHKPFTARRQSFSGRNKMNSLHVVGLSTISERTYDRVPTPILVQNALRRARKVINEGRSIEDCADEMISQPSIIDASIPNALQLPTGRSFDRIDRENVAPQNGSLLASLPSTDTSENVTFWPISQPSIMDTAIPGKLGSDHFNRSLFY